MTIADLFVNIGIKGSDKAAKETKGVKDGMNSIVDSGLAAKAAIVGVMYGLEQLMSKSAKTGTNLVQFASFTGLSAETLQRWQYAARQAGESSDELLGNVKSVQAAMTSMLTGGKPPEGMQMVGRAVGFDPSKARDTFYVLNKLQEYAQKTKDTPDLANKVMGSFGLSEGTIAAMRRNAFQAKTLSAAPVYSDGEIGKLNKVDVAWGNVGKQIEMAMGHLTAKHGLSIVKDISGVTVQVLKLVEALTTLSEKLKLLQLFGKIFEGWGYILKGINENVSGVTSDKKGIGSGLKNQSGKFLSGLALAGKGAFETLKENMTAPPTTQVAGGHSTTHNINQNLHFQHPGKDHARTGDSVKKAVQGALRQMPAQNQGS